MSKNKLKFFRSVDTNMFIIYIINIEVWVAPLGRRPCLGEKLYTVKKTRPGADCGSDHELLIAKFRLKLKKVGKTTRPFRYDLNHIPYDYTVEVRNRFKGLDLIDRVPDELWLEVLDIVQETGFKTIHVEKKCKKAKWLSEEALQIAVKKENQKAKGKRKDISI